MSGWSFDVNMISRTLMQMGLQQVHADKPRQYSASLLRGDKEYGQVGVYFPDEFIRVALMIQVLNEDIINNASMEFLNIADAILDPEDTTPIGNWMATIEPDQRVREAKSCKKKINGKDVKLTYLINPALGFNISLEVTNP